MTKTKMRRLLGLILCGVVAVGLIVGCASSQLTSGVTPATSPSEPPASAISATQSPSQEVAPSPTIGGPTATPDASEMDATLRAEYAAFATERATMGVTVVPYETEAAYRTAGALDRTRQAELMYTPTPFGPLPFPGTRLTDEELAERGWPRILESGKRNEDYHTTAIWLDKAYVDAEIFSQYQALFELLAFRDGPPGEDFEARLGELMIVDDTDYSNLDAILNENRDFANLATCGFDEIRNNVSSLKDNGAYLTYDWVLPNTILVWDYSDPLQSPPTKLTDKLTAFEANTIFFAGFRMQGAPPGANESATIRFTIKSVAAGSPLGSWLATYDPFSDTRHDAVAVWVSEVENWRFLRFGSQFCDAVYPTSITKHLGN